MNLRDILRTKGTNVHMIGLTATLADVARKLSEHNCGALVVCEDDQLVGIISERDVIRAAADLDEMLETIPVEARMTTEVIVGSMDDEIEEVMGLMTKHRIRHLPVMEGVRLAGIVSIGDLVKAHHDRVCLENEYLKHYIHS